MACFHLRPLAWDFYWQRLLVYTIFVWISIVVNASAHDTLDR